MSLFPFSCLFAMKWWLAIVYLLKDLSSYDSLTHSQIPQNTQWNSIIQLFPLILYHKIFWYRSVLLMLLFLNLKSSGYTKLYRIGTGAFLWVILSSYPAFKFWPVASAEKWDLILNFSVVRLQDFMCWEKTKVAL